MKRILAYKITNDDAGIPINEFLKKKGYSRKVIIQLKQTQDGIHRNGIWAYVTEFLNADDILTIRLIEEQTSESIVPVKQELSISYEDEDILIVNKPANMPIHPSQNHYKDTLANALAFYFQERGKAFIYRCINRLDRDTSGLVLIAKHSLSSCILSECVRTRCLQRTYLAVVEGMLPETGRIEAPIALKEGSSIERIVDFSNGSFAATNYERLNYRNGYSLAKIHLETGRTHQIRVHMNYIDHPLPGDYLYHPDYEVINRQALHSYALSFPHPITQAPMHFTAPLPFDMQSIFNEKKK